MEPKKRWFLCRTFFFVTALPGFFTPPPEFRINSSELIPTVEIGNPKSNSEFRNSTMYTFFFFFFFPHTAVRGFIRGTQIGLFSSLGIFSGVLQKCFLKWKSAPGGGVLFFSDQPASQS